MLDLRLATSLPRTVHDPSEVRLKEEEQDDLLIEIGILQDNSTASEEDEGREEVYSPGWPLQRRSSRECRPVRRFQYNDPWEWNVI